MFKTNETMAVQYNVEYKRTPMKRGWSVQNNASPATSTFQQYIERNLNSSIMHSLVYLMFIAFSSCLAHYRGSYESRNFITREEPSPDEGVLVECPVCEESEHWMASNEECPIRKGNKTFKICKYGTYTNEVCGKRLDCYRGPSEKCTEKHEFDMYGKKCAPGYYCHKWASVCTGPEYRLDSNWQWHFIPFTGRRSELKVLPEDSKFSFEGIRN